MEKDNRGREKQQHLRGEVCHQNAFCKAEHECFNKENLLLSLSFDMAAKKRKKDLMNNNTKVSYFHREKWIYVHKGSTKERHGYCTLGEAFNRLDFCSAIKDTRRFNYVVRLLELIAKSQLPSLSGVAQKNYMNILERVVQKVSDRSLIARQNSCRSARRPAGRASHQRAASDALSLAVRSGSGHGQVCAGGEYQHMGAPHGQYPAMAAAAKQHPYQQGMTLMELPASLQLNIMQRLSDGRDLVCLGQVCPELGGLAEDRLLWKRLCQYHFTDRQIRKRLMVSDKGHLEWKKMYFKLSRCYPRREQYSDTLHFCSHCHILFWKDTNHPCTANNPESCTMALSPQDFINLFKF
ncbi:F-box only protein 32 isoform X3 [Phycodurus eques]|uniref:F-box only protein 32 isoform X3 n=1 Tax=Phycodurus eques TaxID=693459 RepID=UPI002ACEEBB6|nr:F-box only protein 32 isoform X3 [Phycodurus eques]